MSYNSNSRNQSSLPLLLLHLILLKVLEACYKHTSQPLPKKIDEFELLVGFLFKNLETSDIPLRRATSAIVSNLLSLACNPMAEFKMIIKKGSKLGSPTSSQMILLTITEVLKVLSRQLAKSSTKEIKSSILLTYSLFFKSLDLEVLNTSFKDISADLQLIACNAKLTTNWSETLYIRESLVFILSQIGKRLSERNQVDGLEILLKMISNDNMSSSNKEAPHNYSLTCTLMQISNMVAELGAAGGRLETLMFESLTMLIQNTSETVNISLAHTIKSVCINHPSILVSFMDKLTTIIQKELGNLNSDKPELCRKFIGYGTILSAVISAIVFNPFYVPFEYSAKVFGFALQLLKQSGSSPLIDFKIQATHITVSWQLISALMTLGPTFVKTHTSQLFLIWKTLFAKPSTKEIIANKSEAEISQLILIKECALMSILSFIENNSEELVTLDVAKRFAVCFNNAGTFVASLPSKFTVSISGLQIIERSLMLKKRLFECCIKLVPRSVFESSHLNLLQMAIDVIGPNFEAQIPKLVGPSDTMIIPSCIDQCPFVTWGIIGYSINTLSTLKLDDKSISQFMHTKSEVLFFENLVLFSFILD